MTAFCSYPGKPQHPLGEQYYQVPDYGDICQLCHSEWMQPHVYKRPEPIQAQPTATRLCTSCGMLTEGWCRNVPCTNRARYDSGYCGVCDILCNDGRGVRL